MTSERVIREFADSLVDSNDIADVKHLARSRFKAATQYLHKLEEVCGYPALDLILPSDQPGQIGSRLFVYPASIDSTDNEAKIAEVGIYTYPLISRVGNFAVRAMKMDLTPTATLRNNRESAQILTRTMIAPMVKSLFAKHQVVPSPSSFESLAYYEEVVDYRLQNGICLAPPYGLEDATINDYMERAENNIAVLGNDFQSSLHLELRSA